MTLMKRACLSFLLIALALAGVAVYAQQADAPNLQQVAVLTSDASRNESALVVDVTTAIVVDKDLVIESRDAKVKETVTVKNVYGHNVILKVALKNEFLAGSKLYQ